MSDQIEDVSEEVGVSDEVEFSSGKPALPQAKGPDPEEWGDPADRLQADFERGKYTDADIINAVMEEQQASGGDPIVELQDGRRIKGPDPSKWTVPDDESDDED